MAERGELFRAGHRVSSLPALLRRCLDRWGRPAAIVCDRWRLAELKQHLESVSFPLADLVERGQSFKDGGQDVRDFRAAVLGDHVRPSRSLLLTAAMSEARVTGDPAGNLKLAKRKEGGRRANARDDASAAAILAAAVGHWRWTARARETALALRRRRVSRRHPGSRHHKRPARCCGCHIRRRGGSTYDANSLPRNSGGLRRCGN